VGNQNDSSAPSVWLRSRQAFLDYTRETGAVPPAGHYDIEYWSGVYAGTPWTNLDTTHWPRQYPIGAVNYHEFAHSVRHTLDGDGNHFNWDAIRFAYARHHDLPDKTNEGFAFNEGWAEFWAGQVHRYHDPIDPEVEGDVAWELTLLAAFKRVGRPGMVAILANNPGSIHSIGDFEQAFDALYPGLRLGKLTNPIAIVAQPPWYHVDWAIQTAWAERELAAQQHFISGLEGEFQRAQAIAERTPGVCDGADCHSNYVALTRPNRLRAVIRSRQLAIEQIRFEINARDEIAGRFGDSTLDSWYLGWKSGYLQRIATVNLEELHRAFAAASPLAASDHGRYIVERLRRKIYTFELSSREGHPPPLNWQPNLLTDDPIQPVRTGK
jgi:hypothetical protein